MGAAACQLGLALARSAQRFTVVSGDEIISANDVGRLDASGETRVRRITRQQFIKPTLRGFRTFLRNAFVTGHTQAECPGTVP
jgi:hypothetical protein